MVSLSDFILGLREWLKKEEVIQFIHHSVNYNKGGGETLNGAKAILLNVNTNQQSWLVKTNKRIYKILDDKRKPKALINWSIKKEKLINRPNQQDYTIHPYKKGIDKIIFNAKPDKEYSLNKKLFINNSFDEVMIEFLRD